MPLSPVRTDGISFNAANLSGSVHVCMHLSLQPPVS